MTYSQIAGLGRILSIWAHPDDESWYLGGVMAAARLNGQPVCCLTATKGEEGSQDEARWPSNEIGSIRQTELENALRVLDVTDYHFLGYRDGSCSQIPEKQAGEAILEHIHKFQPDTVFTFGPAGSSGHPDHMAVSQWASAAIKSASLKNKPTLYHAIESTEWYQRIGKELDSKFNFFHDIDMPPLVDQADMDLAFELDEVCLDKKVAALACHISQMESILAGFDRDTWKSLFGFEGFILSQQ